MITQFVSPMDVAVCSWWHKRSKKNLAELFNLTEEQIDELRSSPEYKKCVFFLMLYRRNSDDFEKWVKSYEKKHEEGIKVFGEHMGLDPDTTCRMVDAVRMVHEVIK